MVNLVTKDKNYRGNFCNISLDGAASAAPSQGDGKPDPPHPTERHSSVYCPKCTQLSLQAKIVNLAVLENHLLRVGFKLNPRPMKEMSCSNIQTNYELTMKKIKMVPIPVILTPPQTKDLFFLIIKIIY